MAKRAEVDLFLPQARTQKPSYGFIATDLESGRFSFHFFEYISR
jgi:hypothetical protein